jgi:hypothetical protein
VVDNDDDVVGVGRCTSVVDCKVVGAITRCDVVFNNNMVGDIDWIS